MPSADQAMRPLTDRAQSLDSRRAVGGRRSVATASAPTLVRSKRGARRHPRGPRATRHIVPPPGGSKVVREYSGGWAGEPAMALARRRSRPVSAGPVRLTTRGRAAAILLVLGLLLTAFTIGRLTRPAAANQPVAIRTAVVQPGQTLWQIAGEAAPGVDRRATVERILRLNPAATRGVHVGQTLRLPAR